METIEFAGHKFQYEKLMPEKFKKGVCAFKMIDEDGDTQYLVIVPNTLSEQRDGKEINTPNDGHLAAACPDENTALMVASSIGVAASVAGFIDDKKNPMKQSVEEIAKGMGFDLEKLKAEVKRLKAEGKSPKEVAEILRPRMEEFRKPGGTPDADKGGEW